MTGPRRGGGSASERARRGLLSVVLLATGCAALLLALLVPFYVYPRVAVLPEDPQALQLQRATGGTALVPDLKAPAGARVVKDAGIEVRTFVSRAPVPAEPGSVVWQVATTTSVAGHGVVDARYEHIALDRRTGRSTNCCGDRLYTVVGDTEGATLRHEGFLTFPIHTEKQSYPLWDIQLRRSRTATFAGEERRDGFATYRFVADTPLTRIGYRELPGALFGLDRPSVVAVAEYADRRTFWVEPNTGSVVDLEESLRQQFSFGDRTVVAIDARLSSPPLPTALRDNTLAGVRSLPWLRWRASVVLAVVGGLLVLGWYRIGAGTMDGSPRNPQHRPLGSQL